MTDQTRNINIKKGNESFTIPIHISSQRADYNEIRIRYEERALAAYERFCYLYDKEIHNLDKLIESVQDIGTQLIVREVEKSVSELISLGAYTLNEELFLDKYLDESEFTWDEALEEISEQYAEIILKGSELNDYRVARREARGKIIGGGFGVGGAMQGMAMAGAANLAIGTIHATFNGLAKIVETAGSKLKKDSIFKDKNTKQSLADSIFLTIFNLHFTFIRAINGESIANIQGLISDEDYEKAKAIFQNIQKGRLPEDKIAEALGHCLTLQPYNFDVYYYILQKYDDCNCELEKAAQYFGISHFQESKLKFIEDKAFVDLSSKTKTPIEVLRSIDCYCASFGYHISHPTRLKILGNAVSHFIESRLASNSIDQNQAFENLNHIDSLHKSIGLPISPQLKQKLIDQFRTLIKASTAIEAKTGLENLQKCASILGCNLDIANEKNKLLELAFQNKNLNSYEEFDKSINSLEEIANYIDNTEGFNRRKKEIQDSLNLKKQELSKSEGVISTPINIVMVVIGFLSTLFAVLGLSQTISEGLSGVGIILFVIFGGLALFLLPHTKGALATRLIGIFGHWLISLGTLTFLYFLGMLIGIKSFEFTILVASTLLLGAGYGTYELSKERLQEQGVSTKPNKFILAGIVGALIYAVFLAYYLIFVGMPSSNKEAVISGPNPIIEQIASQPEVQQTEPEIEDQQIVSMDSSLNETKVKLKLIPDQFVGKWDVQPVCSSPAIIMAEGFSPDPDYGGVTVSEVTTYSSNHIVVRGLEEYEGEESPSEFQFTLVNDGEALSLKGNFHASDYDQTYIRCVEQ